MDNSMTWPEALEALKEGKKVKLPEWTGYWFMNHGSILVYTADCEVIDNPFTPDYEHREDWQIIDGKRDFGGAIKALKAGKRVAREGWNGKGIFIEIQRPDENSKMTHPYIYIDTTGLITNNEYAPKNRVPWLASQTDMLSEDWVVLK